MEKALGERISKKLSTAGEETYMINERHRACLRRAVGAIEKAMEAIGQGKSGELVSIDVKSAAIALGELSGELVSEEAINMIFEGFCVGK